MKNAIEFMLTKMAKPWKKSCYYSNSYVVVTVKKTSWDGSNRFEKHFQRTPTIGIENIENKMPVLKITYYCRTTHNGCLYYCIPLIMVGWVAVNDSPFGDTFQ